MTILVKKDSISSKINTVYYVVPASVRAIFIQDFAKGEISYKVKQKSAAKHSTYFKYSFGSLSLIILSSFSGIIGFDR